MTSGLSKDDFRAQLIAKGQFYHIHHPLHKKMHSGECSKKQIQGWVANRFYYHACIPMKDAAIMANCRDRAVRQEWMQRIIDQDGMLNSDGSPSAGGVEKWLQLGEAVGLNREDLLAETYVLPAVRFAVDAYVNFARTASWQEAVCSSLTELFAPNIHQSRLNSWPEHYPWIASSGLEYFQKRLSEARRDVEHGLKVTLDHFVTHEQQQRALNILQFKLDVLWTISDAILMAYELGYAPYGNITDEPVYHRNLNQ